MRLFPPFVDVLHRSSLANCPVKLVEKSTKFFTKLGDTRIPLNLKFLPSFTISPFIFIPSMFSQSFFPAKQWVDCLQWGFCRQQRNFKWSCAFFRWPFFVLYQRKKAIKVRQKPIWIRKEEKKRLHMCARIGQFYRFFRTFHLYQGGGRMFYHNSSIQSRQPMY